MAGATPVWARQVGDLLAMPCKMQYSAAVVSRVCYTASEEGALKAGPCTPLGSEIPCPNLLGVAQSTPTGCGLAQGSRFRKPAFSRMFVGLQPSKNAQRNQADVTF
eukprot:355838-Chlamydomonas_euryale.AAC.3